MRGNRAYKRKEPFRDSRLFVIVCKGAKRERIYFQGSQRHTQHIRIKVVEHKSASDQLLNGY